MPPPELSANTRTSEKRPRVAIIGAGNDLTSSTTHQIFFDLTRRPPGITGVSAAAACLRSGVEVVLFEQSDQIGGIWSTVNETSCIQFQSLYYRFHPLVRFYTPFPKTGDILCELQRIARLYHLGPRTRFNTLVHHVKPRDDSKWSVDGEIFDGVIAAVGTCGPPHLPTWNGFDTFTGQSMHSSEMNRISLPEEVPEEGLRLAVVGSGASSIEFVDYVLGQYPEECLGFGKGKIEITMIARQDKWIIPRDPFLSAFASLLPVPCGFLFECFLRRFWYGSELGAMTPHRPFYASTPCLNTNFLRLIRDGKIRYIRGTINHFDASGIHVNALWDSLDMLGQPALDAAKALRVYVEAQVVCRATGYLRPKLEFVDKCVWRGPNGPEEFLPPQLYLLACAPAYPTLFFLNSSYIDAVATAGSWHIGLLTRTFLMYMLDASTRPDPHEAQCWIDKRRAKMTLADVALARSVSTEPAGTAHSSVGGYDRWKEEGLRFFSYGELMIWIFSSYLTAKRWRWLLYAVGWDKSRGVNAAAACHRINDSTRKVGDVDISTYHKLAQSCGLKIIKLS
ncbi:hypothetical protein DFS34DRAFT_690966 [Phlyctochytrium arcticum]|nr:hypothetical protein DFS34DRAFT_690966 [Phlyctochytrium arcticum]